MGRPTVSYINVISILGAIAMFLFGMSTMTDGLEKLSSGRLENLLERLTSNVFLGVLLGALVTGLIQSSAATTVMCVGFVNAGIMKLRQTVGIIMGANIGTTVTAQLLRLGDISSDNIFLTLLKPSALGPILALVGIIFYMFIRGGRKRIIGQIILGLGILFIGMNTMETSVSPLTELPEFSSLLVRFSNPFFGVLAGAVVTALLQSSSASMGILQAVSSTGAIQFGTAIPLIMGQNIGTCITAMISSIGASHNAKRTAAIHLSFNVIGTAIFLIVLYAGNALFHFSFWDVTMNRGSIANLHLGFNVACTLLLLPFNRQLVTLVERLVPGEAETQATSVLDERFLSSPSLALDKARDTVIQMGHEACGNYHRAAELLIEFDEHKLQRLLESETALDKMEVALDNYLVKLTDRALTDSESQRISELLHSLSDYERIGDYAVNISECATALHERSLVFSSAAQKELTTLTSAVGEVVDSTVECYKQRNREVAIKVEPLEEVVDLICDALRSRHIERLKTGACTVELGTQFLELLFNLERISDHCSNLAFRVVQLLSPKDMNVEDSHSYLQSLHAGNSELFNRMFQNYKEQYFKPIESLENEK